MVPFANMLFCFFENRIYSRKLWVSISIVGGCNLLSLFQSSYKNFKTHFVKVCASKQCPTLDGFPLYWSQPLILMGQDP